MCLQKSEWFDLSRFKEAPSNKSLLQMHKYIDFIELQAVSGIDHLYVSDTFGNTIDDFSNIISGDEGMSKDEIADHNLTDMLIKVDEDYDEDHLPSRISVNEHLRKQTKLLCYKQEKFAAYWPFDLAINKANKSFELTFNPQHPYAYLYVLMLLCANTAFIKKDNNTFTDFFEQEISYNYLSQIFPKSSGWNIKNFGASATKNTYTGNLNEKFHALYKDTNIERTNYKLTLSGDGKIDFVAFLSSDDERGCLPIIFGQSACTNDLQTLEKKITEVSFDSLSDILHLHVHHIPFLFSPVDLFSEDQKKKFIITNKKAAIVDRMRLLTKIDSTISIPDKLKKMISNLIFANHNYLS